MNIKIEIDESALKQLEDAAMQALEMTVEAVKSDIITSAVVPKETGQLERSGFVDTSEKSKGKISIAFDTPYARRLYWHPEFNFRTDKNPNAQGKWMHSYIDGDKKDFAKKTFETIFKKLAKGVVK